jgi:putative ABC transport system permease protein
MTARRHQFRENLLLAFDTFRTHKFRSFLTVLGVFIGTTTVIAVTSIIAGLDRQLVDVAEQFGTRTLWVYKLQLGAPHMLTRDERLRRPLSYEDGMAIKEQCRSVETVSVELFREMGDFGLPPVTARYKRQDMLDALFVGVTADHLRLINATLGEGRFFSEADDLHHRDVAVIGYGVRERFFRTADPIGKTILVDGHNLEVIGTLTKFKSFLGDDQNDKAILIPYQSFKKTYPEARDNFLCVLARPGQMNGAKDEVTELLRRRRQVKPVDPDNFGISSAEALIGQFRQIIGTVALVMVVISSIGLLVGGIGVMNIMLSR